MASNACNSNAMCDLSDYYENDKILFYVELIKI